MMRRGVRSKAILSSSLMPTRTQQLLCNTAVTNSKLEATEKGISPSDSNTGELWAERDASHHDDQQILSFPCSTVMPLKKLTTPPQACIGQNPSRNASLRHAVFRMPHLQGKKRCTPSTTPVPLRFSPHCLQTHFSKWTKWRWNHGGNER